MPLVSVVMPVYNSAMYVEDSIVSILQQTMTDFELIVVDDGSTDESVDIIRKISDDRIVLICNDRNRGISYTTNRALKAAKGKYIAHLDSDDLSLPNRLEEELNYLEKNPDVTLCGSNIEAFGDDQYITKSVDDSDKLWTEILFTSPIAHSTWMIRKSDMPLYNETMTSSLDYELLLQLFIQKKKIGIVRQPLVRYRVRSNSVSHIYSASRINKNDVRVQSEAAALLGVEYTEEEIRCINNCSSRNLFRQAGTLISISLRIARGNNRCRLFHKGKLRSFLLIYCIKKMKGILFRGLSKA